jgi:hypothetical protein
MVIDIIDNAFTHCEYSNNPLPPIQFSKYIKWNRNNINYLDTSKSIFATEYDIKNPNFLSYNGKKVAWLLECYELNKELYEWILTNYNLYDVVFTHSLDLCSRIPNSYWVPFGGCWIHKEDWNLHKKSKNISIVASSKTFLPGHKLRHEVISNFTNIDLFGGGYNPIDNKITSLKEYKYQIVIENASIPGYFTEKIIDCFVTGTIPIYYGDPKIGEIFNINGIITFSNIEELKNILENPKDIDEKYILENFEKSKEYILTEDYIYIKHKELL